MGEIHYTPFSSYFPHNNNPGLRVNEVTQLAFLAKAALELMVSHFLAGALTATPNRLYVLCYMLWRPTNKPVSGIH